eukprot:jgi/Astpho2/2599/Aster-x0543
MGGWFSKVGTDSFYASLDKQLQHLQENTQRLQELQRVRLQRQQAIGTSIIIWSVGVFGILLAYAAWVIRQPAGMFTARGHALRVAPVILEPVAAVLLHHLMLWLLTLRDQRIANRLKHLEQRRRKILTELKDSTRYQKTQALLEKYDPEYVPPSPRGAGQMSHAFASPEPRKRQLAGGAGGATPASVLKTGFGAAGSRVMPLLGAVANLVGDNPELQGALQAARSDAEALRQRVGRLTLENRELRARLGEPTDGDADEAPLEGDEAAQAQYAGSEDGGGPLKGRDLLRALSDAAPLSNDPAAGRCKQESPLGLSSM